MSVSVRLDEAGAPRYSVRLAGREVIRESKLGLVRDDADFSRGLEILGSPKRSQVSERYRIATAKRRDNRYQANRAVVPLKDAEGRRLDLMLQVSNDGLGFRYRFPKADATVRHIRSEATSFRFPEGTEAWLQPVAVAKSGWAETNPSYEEYYEMGIPVGTPSTLGAGWVFPALFRTDHAWVLLSEAAPQRGYCNSRLSHESPDGEYGIAFADPRETVHGGPSHPQSTLPWQTPWRLIVVGSLRTVVESMLGIDLADPPAKDATACAPGIASWSWPLLGDQSCTFDIQKRFIDYAAEMGWRYTLVDAMWDQQIGDGKMRELVAYAKPKKVEILVWLNSAGDWNSAHQTPRDQLLTADQRRETFERLAGLGVSGVKIDFFPGDGQSVVNYQLDLIEEAGRHGLSVNFHGTTLPRGLQRTYPNFLTAEAVRGLEFMTFEQRWADREPAHAAMLPFARNVFDPMDFTPMALDKLNDRVERRTTAAFELALAVLFTSGIQHLAEVPEGMAKAPDEVRSFLKQLPAAWDDLRFLDGYPGKHVVIARRSGDRWIVAGINGTDEAQTVTLDLTGLGDGPGRLITDGPGGELGFAVRDLAIEAGEPQELTLVPRGGFVWTRD